MAGRGGKTIGKDLPPGHITFADLARLTSVPVGTLRRWRKQGKLPAAGSKRYGKLTVHTFDLDSIVRVKKLRANLEGISTTNTES